MKERWLAPAIFSVCVIGAFAYLWIIPMIFNSAPVEMDHLKRIQNGMSKEEVRKILGMPSYIYKDGQIWSYSGIGWAIAYVDFDSQVKVRNVRYDP